MSQVLEGSTINVQANTYGPSLFVWIINQIRTANNGGDSGQSNKFFWRRW